MFDGTLFLENHFMSIDLLSTSHLSDKKTGPEPE